MLTCSSTGTHVDNAVTIIKGKGNTEVTLFKTCRNLQHKGGFVIPLEINNVREWDTTQLKEFTIIEGHTHVPRHLDRKSTFASQIDIIPNTHPDYP